MRYFPTSARPNRRNDGVQRIDGQKATLQIREGRHDLGRAPQVVGRSWIFNQC